MNCFIDQFRFNTAFIAAFTRIVFVLHMNLALVSSTQEQWLAWLRATFDFQQQGYDKTDGDERDDDVYRIVLIVVQK